MRTAKDRSTSVWSGLLQNLDFKGLVSVPVSDPEGQKTGPNWTFENYYQVTIPYYGTLGPFITD